MTDAMALLGQARQVLGRTPAIVEHLVADLDVAGWCARPAPAEWSAVEIVCHLRDEEAEDFGARVRAVLAGSGPVPPIDPEAWAVTRRYREADPADALRAFRALREASLAMLSGASPEALRARLAHPGGLRLTGLDLVAAWMTHDRLHLHQLAGTLARVGADRWRSFRTDYAGPVPYPPADPPGEPPPPGA